jgi:hypothetical protein
LLENRVLRRTLGPKRDEILQGWIRLYNGEHYTGWLRLYNGEHYNLCSSPNTLIIRMIKSRRRRGVGYVAHIVFWWKWQKEKDK